MTGFTVHLLHDTDGTWRAFEDDWRAQCDAIQESFEDYCPDSIEVLRQMAAGKLNATTPLNKNAVAAVRSENGIFYAVFMLNRAHLPGDDGPTLRVRHLIVSPKVDFGDVADDMYARVLIGVFGGVIHLSESDFEANYVKFHLRSPGDVNFFRAVGVALDGEKVFTHVQTRGAWLYITKK